MPNDTATPQTTGSPFKRTVYFVHGLHEFGAEYFTPILKRGCRQHKYVYGRDIQFSKNGEWGGAPEILLENTEDDQKVETTYRFLVWNDIVQERMKRPYMLDILMGIWAMLKLTVTGDLFRIYRYYWGFGNGLTLIGLIPSLVCLGTIFAGWKVSLLFVDHPIINALAGLLLMMLAFAFIRKNEDKFHIHVGVNVLHMRNDQAAGKAPQVDARIDEFAQILGKELQTDDCDEMIIVGHSYGTLLAVDALARALRGVQAQALKPKNLGLLTLGAVHHFVAMRKEAAFYRQALKEIGGDARVQWLEPFCPQDGMNFPKKNAVKDFTDADPVYGPVQRSIKVGELLKPDHYQKFKRNFWHMHFQYLREGDIPGDYSYYRILATPQFLQHNYGLREDVDALKAQLKKKAS